MEHPFFTTANTRAEALRWLTIAEKLLSARDLMGSKSFASRARDSDPTLSQADQILAVADTLLAGDSRVGNNQHDWYSILRLSPSQASDTELVATQYRALALLLNPQQNRFPFSDQAFRLVVDAWSVISNPPRKIVYDRELDFYRQERQPSQQSDPFGNAIPTMPQNFMFFGNSNATGVPNQFAQAQQVHVQNQVEPQESQRFMNFRPGSNMMFDSGPDSQAFGSTINMPSNEANLEQVNSATTPTVTPPHNNSNKRKQPVDDNNNSNDSHKSRHGANTSENGGDRTEGDEENLEGLDEQEEEIGVETADERSEPTFWTACPYCYYMYEYPEMFADCTLKCQKCKKAYQAVVIPSPPPNNGEDYFCCWGFIPMGFSMENWEKHRAATSAWTPFSPMFTLPKMGSTSNASRKAGRPPKSKVPRVYIDDDADDVFVELSDDDSSDDDWRHGGDGGKRKKAKNVGGSSGTLGKTRKTRQVDKGKNPDVQNDIASEIANKRANEPSVTPNNNAVGDPSNNANVLSKKTTGKGKKSVGLTARKQPGRVAKNFGRLDLNVECSNEAEEPAALRTNNGNVGGRGEDDNGGFFEGLDEFFSSLPILNVGEDKGVKAS